MISFSNICIHR